MSYIAERKNRVINIAEEKATEYAKMGYKVFADEGKVIAEPDATTTEGANAEIAKLREGLAEKDAEITKLREELARAAQATQEDAKKPATKKSTAKADAAPATE